MSDSSLQAIAAEEFSFDDLVTPNAFISECAGALSENRVRYLLRDRDINGLTESGSVLQKGHRLLVVKPRFLKWLELN